jgi:hypothetical protein
MDHFFTRLRPELRSIIIFSNSMPATKDEMVALAVRMENNLKRHGAPEPLIRLIRLHQALRDNPRIRIRDARRLQ